MRRRYPGGGVLDRTEFGEPIYVTSGGGGSIGHGATVAWFPESSRVIVIAENAADYDVPSFGGDIAAALIVGTGIPDPPKVTKADPEMVRAAVGRYLLDGGAELLVTEQEGGLLVEATGGDALTALYPVPEGKASLIAQHEQFALDFVAGVTPEGRRERVRLEAEHGPIRSVGIVGTIYDAELSTFLTIDFENHQTLLAIALNPSGGSEAYGYDSWPTTWYVISPDGAFAPYLPNEENPVVGLRPTASGLEIAGPTGSRLVTRAA